MREETSLKKISRWDKIKNFLKGFWGYRAGKGFLIDTQPYIKEYSEIELANIANIEGKLKNILEKNVMHGEIVDGLNANEVNKLLEWVVQADRKCLNINDDIRKSNLMGACGFSQGIIYPIYKDNELDKN